MKARALGPPVELGLSLHSVGRRRKRPGLMSTLRCGNEFEGNLSKMRSLARAEAKCSAQCSARFAQPTQDQERWRPAVEHRAAIHLVFDDSLADPRHGSLGRTHSN